jgi:hypothetical protein
MTKPVVADRTPFRLYDLLVQVCLVIWPLSILAANHVFGISFRYRCRQSCFLSGIDISDVKRDQEDQAVS